MMHILIVDDDPLICKSLELMLNKESDIEVMGTAHNGIQALDLCEKKTPDIILMDIRMPEVDGIQAVRLIKKQFPQIRILMLTTFLDKTNIQMALQAGAEGYLLKTDRLTDIVQKLRTFSVGAAVLDAEVLKNLTEPTPDIPSTEKLTPREKDVFLLVSQGLTNKEISQQLFLSEGTVRNIVSVIMDKLDVKNRTQMSLLLK